MEKKALGIVAVGIVASLALGSIGIATAATVKSGSKTKNTTQTATSDRPARSDDTTGAPHGHRGGGKPDGKRGFGGGGDIAEAIANLSKTTEDEIMKLRAAGTSFNDIAKAKGLTAEAVIAEITRIETAELDAAVKAGTLTEAQRTEILAGMPAHLTEELAETHAIGGTRQGRPRW